MSSYFDSGDKGIPGGSPYVWKHGITETSKWHPKLAGELCCGESLCNKPYSMWSSIPDDIFEPSNGRIFVGFEVVDNWRDGTNGESKCRCQQPVDLLASFLQC